MIWPSWLVQLAAGLTFLWVFGWFTFWALSVYWSRRWVLAQARAADALEEIRDDVCEIRELLLKKK